MNENSGVLAIGNIFNPAYDSGMQKTDIKRLMGANLARIRKDRGLTGDQLGSLAETSASVISGAETGRSFGDDLLARLATALKVEPMEFFRPVRGLGLVAEQQEEYRSIDLPPGTFEFIMPDDSMLPRYELGQPLYASRTATVRSGDFAIVSLPSGELVARQVFFVDNQVILLAVSPRHPPGVYFQRDIRQISRIIWTREA